MSNKLVYALMIIIAIGAVVWGLVSYNDLARNRSELNVLRIEVEALERDLAQTEEELNAVEQELSSAELSIS